MSKCGHPHCSTPRIKPLARVHDFLLEKSTWYHSWHHHPKHQHVHLATFTMVFFLLASLILNSVFLIPDLVAAASNTWNMGTPGDYTYDNTKISFSGGVAELKGYTPGSDWIATASGHDWSYRRTITIDNTGNGSTLSGYQVSITLDTASLISASKMKADGSDIRFTNSDKTSVIRHNIASGINTVSTIIKVQGPDVPANQTLNIYLYYGNSSATDVSFAPDQIAGNTIYLKGDTGLQSDGAADFSAANKEYLTVAKNSTFDVADKSFSWAIWLNPRTVSGTFGILGKRDAGLGSDYMLFMSSGTPAFATDAGGYDALIAGSSCQVNQWNLVTFGYDATAQRKWISVNGGAKTYGAQVARSIGNARDVYLATYPTINVLGNFYDGLMDSVGYWGRAIDDTDIAALYNSGNGQVYSNLSTAQKTNLTSWWDLNEESGTRFDSVGSNHLNASAANIIQPEALGGNLIQNPGFETAGGGGADIWANWSEAANDGAMADEASLVHAGSHAAKMTSGVSGNTYLYQNFSVTAGQSYQFTFWTRGDGSSAGSYKVQDVTNNAPIVSLASTGVSGTTYVLKTVTFTAPTGCTTAFVLLASTTNGGIAYFDDISVKQITTAAANNGGFETAGSPFGSWTATNNGGTGTVNDETDPTKVSTGAHACRIDVDTTTSPQIHISATTPGRKYKVTFSAYSSVNSTTIYIGSNSGGAYATTVSLTTSYASYTVYYTTDGATFRPIWVNGTNRSVWIDSITLQSLGPISSTGITKNSSQDGNFAAQISSSYFNRTDADGSSNLNPGTSNFAISGWFYVDSMPSTQVIFSKGGGGGTQAGFQAYYSTAGGITLNICDGSATRLGGSSADGTVKPATWYNYIVNVDRNSNATMYVNGQSVITMSLLSQPGSLSSVVPFGLGAQGGGGFAMTGRLDNTAFWNGRTLTISEIAYLFNSGKSRQYSDLGIASTDGANLKTNLVSFWEFDNKNNLGFDSVVSSANNLTNNGATQTFGVNYYEGAASKWLDQSGSNVHFTQTTPTKRPVYDAVGINSKPALLFDGSDDALVKAGDQIGTGNITVFTIIKPNGLGGGSAGRIIDNGPFILYVQSGGRIGVLSNGVQASSADSSISLGSGYIVSTTRTSAGVANIYINGQLSGSANQSSGTPIAGSDTYIGNLAGGTRGFDGWIGDTLVYNSILSQTDRYAIENNLSAKYGIALGSVKSPTPAAEGMLYPTDTPTVVSNNAQGYSALQTFSESLGAGSTGSIKYQISPNNGSTWYWWNGGDWATTSAGVSEANDSATVNTNIPTFTAGSPPKQLKWKAYFISDGTQKPRLDAIGLTFIWDSAAPPNPEVAGFDSSEGSTLLTSGMWYNYPHPRFSWSAPTDSAGEGEEASGIAGYYVYFGEDNTAEPVTAGTYQATTTFTVPSETSLVSGHTYYLRMVTKDNAGNPHNGDPSTAETLFTYKYDSNAPAAPDYINVSPQGCSKSATFVFAYPAGSDSESDINSYEYKLGSMGDVKSTTSTIITAEPYQENDNVIYVRSRDNSGNVSNWQSAVFCSVGLIYVTDGPDVTVDVNSITVKWTSSRQTTSQVKIYSEDEKTLVTEKLDETKTANHSLVIPGLKPGTTYHYKLYWADQFGNSGESALFYSTKTTRVSVIEGPTITAGPSSMVVNWSSSKATTGYVKVYDGNTYVSEQGKNEYSQNHSVQIVGLKSEKPYRYKLSWNDEYGNVDESDWYESSTASTPTVLHFRTEVIAPSKALVSWNTNYTANCSLEYGIGNYKDQVTFDGKATSFSRQIENLTAGSNYQIRVKAATDDGAEFSSADTFQTPPLPSISNLKFDYLPSASTTVVATWTTNIPTTSIIAYTPKGKTDTKTVSSADMATDHRLEIKDLQDNTDYDIVAKSMDTYGNYATSDTQHYSTPFDTRPPKVKNLTIEVKATGFGTTQKAQLVATWETDEPATSQLEYALGISGSEYANTTKEDQTLSTSHVVIASELDPSKIYHLRAVSKDRAGNNGTSEDTTVITGKVQQSVIDIIMNSLERSLGWIFRVFK